MHPFPHHYTISAVAAPDGDVALSEQQLPKLVSAPPAEFDGPGDRWSPETLVVAAVADCFVLTFRAVAKLSKLRWATLTCEASGTECWRLQPLRRGEDRRIWDLVSRGPDPHSGQQPRVLKRRLSCTRQTDQDHAFRHGMSRARRRGQYPCSMVQQHPLR
jgi:hypothetical protein